MHESHETRIADIRLPTSDFRSLILHRSTFVSGSALPASHFSASQYTRFPQAVNRCKGPRSVFCLSPCRPTTYRVDICSPGRKIASRWPPPGVRKSLRRKGLWNLAWQRRRTLTIRPFEVMDRGLRGFTRIKPCRCVITPCLWDRLVRHVQRRSEGIAKARKDEGAKKRMQGNANRAFALSQFRDAAPDAGRQEGIGAARRPLFGLAFSARLCIAWSCFCRSSSSSCMRSIFCWFSRSAARALLMAHPSGDE